MLNISVANIIYILINLAILVIIFRVFLFKRVDKIFEARKQEIECANLEAQKREKEANDKIEEYNVNLAKLESEKEIAIQDARNQGLEEYDNIVANANKKAESIVKNAEVISKMEQNRIKEEFEDEMKEIVINAASKLGAAADNDKIEGSLYDKFILAGGEK